MKVSTRLPFQIVYAIYWHQCLGYVFESFVVQLDQHNKLTLQHQNISSRNAHEFASGLDERDYTLIALMDDMQPGAIAKRFGTRLKKAKADDFFLSVYHKEKGDKALQEVIHRYMEEKRATVLHLLPGRPLFEMSEDGEPTARTIRMQQQTASVRFHFKRLPEGTHYFPTILLGEERLALRRNTNVMLLCASPAWLVVDGKLFTFDPPLDGNKLRPFLNKPFVAIPSALEENYYQKFVTSMLEEYDVRVYPTPEEGMEHPTDPDLRVHTLKLQPRARLALYESTDPVLPGQDPQVLLKLEFDYEGYTADAQSIGKRACVSLQVSELPSGRKRFHFQKVLRQQGFECKQLQAMQALGMPNGEWLMTRQQALSWLGEHAALLQEADIEITPLTQGEKRYFIGQAHISVEVVENIDWFDILVQVSFGPYQIPFSTLRKHILAGRQEFTLPNGEIAVIPQAWFEKYTDLAYFMDPGEENRLRKHHLSVLQRLEEGQMARLQMDRKLEKLRDFSHIEDYPMPEGFVGTLRPYQKAGYNWMRFLNDYHFGGCLADDMGLGKTVQTLALLQHEREQELPSTSLIVMPTSLIYNWEMEARKFTPDLRVLVYTGSGRSKDPASFGEYDLVLTSYGIVRMDTDVLGRFAFNYLILDESQTIKNPSSNIAQAVRLLHARNRLILTGTPIENTTMDLWSQMNFLNPGLLGGQAFFRKEFLLPIEKKQDEAKRLKLHNMVRPFIMRRHKSQVATELPGKIEKVCYSEMTPQQQERYERVKSQYRNEILDQIETMGMQSSHMALLKGLTELRQLANHPRLVDTQYEGDSGKMDDVVYNLRNAIEGGHKVLVFSQFVKHLHILRDFLHRHHIGYCYLDGATKDRQSEVHRFQHEPQKQVFLISLKAGGLGLNLTAADFVFILDPWWNPAVEAQAVDRAYRIGQENKVFIYKFITKDSVEEKILRMQQHKLLIADSLIQTEENFMKKLNREDIEALLT